MTTSLVRAFGVTLFIVACSPIEGEKFKFAGQETDQLPEKYDGFWPVEGMISNPATAANVAEAVVSNVYGYAEVKQQRPYTVTTSAGNWIVRGNLKDGLKGGVFEIVIARKDGRIIYLNHGE
jgi:hypothetical protein